jgi:hypothetical protein
MSQAEAKGSTWNVSFRLSTLKAAQPVFNFDIFLFENNFFRRILMHVKQTAINAESYTF